MWYMYCTKYSASRWGHSLYEEVRPKGVTFSDFSNMNLWKVRDYTYERIEKSAILVGKKAQKG